jgi:integrase/recombinase XerC
MDVNFKNKLKLVVNSNSPQKNNTTNINKSISLEENTYSQIINAYTNRLMARRLKPSSIRTTINTINDLFLFTNQYPWDWTAEVFDEWCAYLYRERNNCEATQRHKQNVIARFQSFLVESPQLSDLCKVNFGKKPLLICSPDNLIPHKVPDENKEKRLAFTKDHLKCLWAYFDEQIALAYKNKSKSLKVLQRDKVLYLIIYYYGLRANEVSMLDTTDFLHNPKRPEWNNFGGIIVRFGKASGGSPPKRRTVWTISETSVEYLTWYLESIRPLFGFDESKSLFLTERGCRMNPKTITQNFKEHLKCAGLPHDNYSTHCLRHSYISHLSEDLEISPRFIQEQVGHTYLATTQIYTHLTDAFVSKQLTSVIDRQLAKFLPKGCN